MRWRFTKQQQTVSTMNERESTLYSRLLRLRIKIKTKEKIFSVHSINHGDTRATVGEKNSKCIKINLWSWICNSNSNVTGKIVLESFDADLCSCFQL